MNYLVNKIQSLEEEKNKLQSDLRNVKDRLREVNLELLPLIRQVEKTPNGLDIALMLNGTPSTMEEHREKERQLDLLGLSGLGYSPYTGQTCVKIALYKRDSRRTAKVLAGINLLLPHLQPIPKYNAVVFKIFDRDLSETRSPYLHVKGNTTCSPCYIYDARTGRETASFSSISEALDFIQKNLWYKK